MRGLNRAVFPLIVIILLVYLASQTFLGDEGGDTTVDYSELLDRVDSSPDSVSKVTFTPKSHGIEAELTSGETLTAHYTTDESAFALEQKLRSEDIRFDSKGTGGSAWWSILTYLLPFVLFFGFWIFLMRQVQGKKGRKDGDATSGEPDRSF